MLRTVLAVVAGYLLMFVCVFATFSAAYLLMGPDGAFLPGSYQVSATWLLASFVLGLLAAVLGGIACAKIAPGGRAPAALAVLVLVLGFASAVPVMMSSGDPPAVREGAAGNVEAMNNARQPVWVALLNPLVGAAGVMAGARLVSRPGAAGDS
jgi:hypothetical protein